MSTAHIVDYKKQNLMFHINVKSKKLVTNSLKEFPSLGIYPIGVIKDVQFIYALGKSGDNIFLSPADVLNPEDMGTSNWILL